MEVALDTAAPITRPAKLGGENFFEGLALPGYAPHPVSGQVYDMWVQLGMGK
jgi:hypothetical protein